MLPVTPRQRRHAARLLLIAAGATLALPAGASPLDNSVRVGDRSRMNIVKVPKPGQKIVLPSATNRVAGRPPGTVPGERLARPGPQDWFWQRHDTALAAAAPERWAAALATLRGRRAAGTRLVGTRTLERIVTRHGALIAEAAERHTISAALLAAVIAVESRGQIRATSHAGAEGLMQLIPATAARFGVTNSFDPRQNILGGAAYLSWLLNRFRQDTILALAGYNAGEGAVDKHDGVPPYRETRDYVVKVFDALAAAERLCLKPPATPRHPCDWRLASN